MNGIVNILKPTGMTSHDVVSRVRRITKQKKVGHTGTLDPNASGVLPICIGNATKVSEYLLNKDKEYRASLTLGIITDTYDSYGQIVSKKVVENISHDEIKRVFNTFMGEIDQVPPMYSALKVNGKKLYELARAGEIIDIKSRKVNIKNIEIINIKDNEIMFDVSCSKGTYIRSLCKDIGDALGCGGYMSMLIRKSSGIFNIENSVTLEELEEDAEKINEYIFPVDYALDNYKNLVIKDGALNAYLNGNVIYDKGILSSDSKDEGFVKVYCNGKFYGIGKIMYFEDRMCVKSKKLFL